MRAKVVVAATALLLAVLVIAVATAADRSRDRGLSVHRGCPDRSVRVGVTADQAMAAARRVMIDHRTVYYQGRRLRVTAQNWPVIQVLALGGYPDLASPGGLAREAVRRCGRQPAPQLWGWAVVFHDSLSPMCCSYPSAFVARTERGLYVF
jgi:hypothetical protein